MAIYLGHPLWPTKLTRKGYQLTTYMTNLKSLWTSAGITVTDTMRQTAGTSRVSSGNSISNLKKVTRLSTTGWIS